MKDILKAMEEGVVKRSNTLRFNCNDCFETVLRSDTINVQQKLIFLLSVFGWSITTCQTILKRINNESFIDITNELNLKSAL